jgi:hypothetical protein
MKLKVGKYALFKVTSLRKGGEIAELGDWRPVEGGAVEKWSCDDCFTYVTSHVYRYISVQCTEHQWLVPEMKRLLLEEMWARTGQLIHEMESKAKEPAPRKRPTVPRPTRRSRADDATRRRNGLS